MRDLRQAPQGGALACALGAVAVATALAGCGLNQNGVPPPLNHISFPGSALVDPSDPRWLYVANSNSDLRYNNGTLVTVDLELAAADRKPRMPPDEPWQVCQGPDYIRPDDAPDDFCCWDYLDHTILDCDERAYINSDSTVLIGSFAAGMVFQPSRDPGCDTGAKFDKSAPTNRNDCFAACPPAGVGRTGRLFLGTRGNSAITYTDVSHDTLGASPRFGCMDHPDGKVGCSVSQEPQMAGVTPVIVPDEPYALSLDPTTDLLYVGHLRGDTAHFGTGGISLFDVSGSSLGTVPPLYLGSSGSVFAADGNGQFGITSLTWNAARQATYATSRYSTSAVGVSAPLASQVPSLSPPGSQCSSDSKTYFVQATSDSFTTPLIGGEIRGIQFLPGAARAFLLQRTPPALVGFDIANGEFGLFGNVPTDILETCQAPTFLQVNPLEDDENLYVTCFDAGQVYVFDPTVPRLTNVIDVGRGPAGLVFPPSKDADGKVLAYVVGFSANNVSVLDLTPGSPTRYHIIQRIGFPSANPR